jgi:hypothetical protein
MTDEQGLAEILPQHVRRLLRLLHPKTRFLLVELHLRKACVQLYGVKQVASLCWLQIDCLILVIVRSDYILSPLVRAVGPYLSRLDDPAYAHEP